jgi:hypothetical protein
MTASGTLVAALVAAAAAVTGGVLGDDSPVQSDTRSRAALVIDAALARDGRDLVDPRLRKADAEVRLPRTPAEALTDVRYFAAQNRRLVVAGPRSGAAAKAAALPAVRASSIADALAVPAR